ncbi:SDR family oxidoreductase [Sphingomonas sp. JC676]|uniref:SDR family oxidoreductase n=1 Tax=Sphingomonas sp. JC676 TaxID=2768065 RepID=UPI001657B95E|nr:SDR family oxidoreductase [Sphingomonas sp. JC676]MBC9035064.1 SDR family oxidoreductase [Sphingomonas sp. JC676]
MARLPEDKTVLVTSASTGIDRAAANGAAQHANIAITYRRDDAGAGSCVTKTEKLGRLGIRSNPVLPGTVLTEINKEDLATAERRYLEGRVPFGRLGQPEDMIGPIVFLASDMAEYVTGAALLVDGHAFRQPAIAAFPDPSETP